MKVKKFIKNFKRDGDTERGMQKSKIFLFLELAINTD